MVTGDHPITAKAIARMVGIISPGKHNIILLGDFYKHFIMQETLLWLHDPKSLSTAVMKLVVPGC